MTTSTVKVITRLVGSVMLVLGLAYGLWPQYSDNPFRTSCGSAFFETDGDRPYDCGPKIGRARAISITVAAIGLTVLIVGESMPDRSASKGESRP